MSLNSIRHKKKRTHTIAVSISTRHSYKVLLVSFFNYCRKIGYLVRNPAKYICLPEFKKRDPMAYTPEQITYILNTTKEESVARLYVCIAAFSGIRPAEIGRLRWSDIDVEEREIRLSSAVTKMSSRRIVHIQDNLAEWLTSWSEYFGSEEFVIPNLKIVQHSILRKLKQLQFPTIHDGLRHSFGSYLQALLGDCDKVIEQMGHTRSIFKTHYMNIVREDDAQRYFSITPTTLKEYE